jgi:hypothetical protein
MDKKETSSLTVKADFSFPESEIVINPNDGFDLGFMMTDAKALFYYADDPKTVERGGVRPIEGTVVQKNECALGTVEISLKAAEKLGTPKKVRLHLLPRDTQPHLLIIPDGT